MQQLVIEQPSLHVAQGRARAEAIIRMPTGVHTLWFECDARFAELIDAQSSDAFVVALLVVAMREGWEVVAEGSLSTRLYYNLNQHYVELMRHCAPGLRAVPVRATSLERREHGGSGVILGFSGGVDSFSVVVEHHKGKVPPPMSSPTCWSTTSGRTGRPNTITRYSSSAPPVLRTLPAP